LTIDCFEENTADKVCWWYGLNAIRPASEREIEAFLDAYPGCLTVRERANEARERGDIQ